jgi:hypothetical protein
MTATDFVAAHLPGVSNTRAPIRPFVARTQGNTTMHDMLTAFHLVRYFELRHREEEPCRDMLPARRAARPGLLRRLLRLRARSQG